jgi:hypothetical protein
MWKFLRGNLRPDAAPHFFEHSGAHETLDDAEGGLWGDVQGIPKALDRDDRRGSVDDFFQNGPDDLGTTIRITTVRATLGTTTVQLHGTSP